jgi:hypothetical protein
MRFEIYGGSDDLVEIRRNGEDWEELNGDDLILQLVARGGYGLEVQARYGFGTGATWSFAPTYIDDGQPMPSDWVITVENEHDYSTRLVIDTRSDTVKVRWCLASQRNAPKWEDVK